MLRTVKVSYKNFYSVSVIFCIFLKNFFFLQFHFFLLCSFSSNFLLFNLIFFGFQKTDRKILELNEPK